MEYSLNALAVIPARYGSTRFSGKPLACETGKPMIQHVVEQVNLARHIGKVLVATDDQRIYDAVMAFSGQAGAQAVPVMTGEHPNGTSRIAEAVVTYDASLADDAIIVNIQGDEPQISPDVIDELVMGLDKDKASPMATLASAFSEGQDPADPNIVKMILDQQDRAIYFSRSLIPHNRDHDSVVPLLRHPGCYAYRKGFLLTYVTLPPTPLEEAEKLEQLRAIEHGYKIAVIKTHVEHTGIDTLAQYESFVKSVR